MKSLSNIVTIAQYFSGIHECIDILVVWENPFYFQVFNNCELLQRFCDIVCGIVVCCVGVVRVVCGKSDNYADFVT